MQIVSTFRPTAAAVVRKFPCVGLFGLRFSRETVPNARSTTFPPGTRHCTTVFSLRPPEREILGIRKLHTSSPRFKCPDPYAVLGIPRHATQTEIKKRYRELAKKHHPDLNPESKDASKMAGISAAYQLLSDPKKKQFYDQTGMSPEEAGVSTDGNPFQQYGQGAGSPFPFADFADLFAGAFQSRAHRYGTQGADMTTELTLSFMEAARGCTRSVPLRRETSCSACSGSGLTPGTKTSTCTTCGGTGMETIQQGAMIFSTPCSQCDGRGETIDDPCKVCKGAGVRLETQTVEIRIPEGFRDGFELRIPQKGHAGRRGGYPGDLRVKVNVHPHPQFKSDGDDLHVTVPLSLAQCLLGGDVSVPTLDTPMTLKVLPGTSPGQTRRIYNKGLKHLHNGGYGDLVVHWTLKMPKSLSPRQRELILEFDALCQQDSSGPRRDTKTSQHSAGSKPSSSNTPRTTTAEGDRNVVSRKSSSSNRQDSTPASQHSVKTDSSTTSSIKDSKIQDATAPQAGKSSRWFQRKDNSNSSSTSPPP